MTIELLLTFLGWATLLNMGLLIFTTILLTLFRKPIIAIHAKLTGLKEEDLPKEYFRYLGNYKIALVVFNLVPYLALRCMV